VELNSKKTNHTAHSEAGRVTRLSANWPGTRCLTRTRKGTPCQNLAIEHAKD